MGVPVMLKTLDGEAILYITPLSLPGVDFDDEVQQVADLLDGGESCRFAVINLGSGELAGNGLAPLLAVLAGADGRREAPRSIVVTTNPVTRFDVETLISGLFGDHAVPIFASLPVALAYVRITRARERAA